MDDHPYLIYMLSDERIYETLERREPDDDLHSLVESHWPEDWNVHRGAFWTQVNPPSREFIAYGWKIHVSSTFDDCRRILEACVPAMIAAEVGFKFLSDEYMVSLSLNKNWPRSQVGKFITIYPQSLEHCKELAEVLAGLTEGYAGPFILTDMPVGESKSVYVRYGAHIADFRLSRYGMREAGYLHEDGTWRRDHRRPLQLATAAPWEQTPPPKAESRVQEAPVLIGGRFSIVKAIKYHGEGGVYHGIDTQTGMEVIVREQRRGLTGMPGRAGITTGYTIHKEALLLQKAQSSGKTPAYVAHFEEDEHWFLVQERIVGSDTLWGHAMNIYFGSEDLSGATILDKLRSIFLKIAEGIKAVHRSGVVLRDLTKTNVLVTVDEDVRFIDLEFAHAIEEKSPWVLGWTRGYGSPQQRADKSPVVQDDYYAFGALILDMITFTASGLDLDRGLIVRKIDRCLLDLDLPVELKDVVMGLIDEDVGSRWSIERAIEALKALTARGRGTPVLPTAFSGSRPADQKLIIASARSALTELDRFFESSASHARHDRLWPGSPDQWSVNAVGIGYGAAGVALYQLQRGTLQADTISWIVERSRPSLCPAGLFVGLSGIAYVLCQAGRWEDAARIYDDAWKSKDGIGESLYFGLAGLGLVSIHLFLWSGVETYRQRAIQCADLICSAALHDGAGTFWEVNGRTPIGLAEGQSGIALFFIYLHKVAPELGYLELARMALDYELAHRVAMSGQLLWHRHAAAKSIEPKTPHVWAGTAGIAAVLLRYYVVTGDQKYKKILDGCIHTVSSRYSNKIWQSEGLSGMLELHLDVASFLPEQAEQQRAVAFHLAEAILDHVTTPCINGISGIAFPGSEHLRICSDFSNGSAGIGIGLDRLVNGGARVLFLDELLGRPIEGSESASAEVANAG